MIKGMTKSEIEREISVMGDYVKIDNLVRYLKNNPHAPTDIKKFIYQKLADIYENKNMFYDTGKCYEKLIELSNVSPSTDKSEYYLKAIENYAKASLFNDAERIAKIAIADKNIAKMDIAKYLREVYKSEAEKSIQKNKRSNAVNIYKRLIEMQTVPSIEKNEIKKILLKLYLDLGNITEYKILESRTFTEAPPRRIIQNERISGLEWLYN